MVTLFGQSGGGRKIDTLLAMPSAKGLFHRAVIESGVAIKVVDRDIATRNAEMLLAILHISKTDVHKVRNKPLDQIIAAYFAVNQTLGNVDLNSMGFAPTVDGIILPQHPFHPTASPVSADVPVMIGSTRTEWTAFAEPALFHLDESGMKEQAKKLLGVQSEEMINLYRKQNPGASPTDLFLFIISDYKYGAATMKIAVRRAALGRGPVFLYNFAWETPVRDGILRSPHSMEIPFVSDRIRESVKDTGGGSQAIALADKISDTWIAFARSGNPNNPKIPNWPSFNPNDRATMIFNNEIKVVNDPFREQRIAMFRALNLTL